MITSRHIPQHLGNDAQDWQHFLTKAASGSYRAVEMLDAADLAYMSALSAEPYVATLSADRSLGAGLTDHYQTRFRKRFPRSPPAGTAQSLFTLCFRHGYFPNQLRMGAAPPLPASAYCNIWAGGKPVSVDCLVHDAVLTCFQRWSPELCINEPGDTDYDSLAVVISMLAFCISWPR